MRLPVVDSCALTPWASTPRNSCGARAATIAWTAASMLPSGEFLKPTTEEKATCAPWLDRDLELAAPHVTAIMALGSIAWDSTLAAARRLGWAVPRPKPRFGHGAEATLALPNGNPVRLVGCYHVSQQNTFTGKLTEPMLDAAIARLRP